MGWIDEVLGKSWKHKIVNPSTLIVPSTIAFVHDKLCSTGYFIPSLVACIIAVSLMIHHNIGVYNK